MEADLQAQLAFFLSGKRSTGQLDAVDDLDLRPALFTGYRDLAKLRYDFPLVLTSSGDICALSALIDELLEKIATGDEADRIRKHVLRLEQDIRGRAAAGEQGSLSELWTAAGQPLAATDPLVADSLARARAVLKQDGTVVDCDQGLPARLLEHAWNAAQAGRLRRFAAQVAGLILKLSDILKAEFVNSDAGRSPVSLKATFGSGPMDTFDFDAMSRILKQSQAKTALSKRRRQRIEGLLSVLKAQRFVALPDGAAKPYSFVFTSCAGALKAYRERLPKVIELARAIAVAELEARGEYDDAKHDPLFEAYGENGLDAQDVELFPDYLVCVNTAGMAATEQDKLGEAFASGLPMKILVQTDDILGEIAGDGQLGLGLRSKQLASMAMAGNDVYVMQSAASNLYRVRDALKRGLDYRGPALFSVFSGAVGADSGVSPYLTGAAAMEARLFPAFVFDPTSGSDWASRFSLAGNPQNELDWPLQGFSYEDEEHQTVAETVPFTPIDFVAGDRRYARHFARVPRAKWNGTMVPAGEFVASQSTGLPDKLPFLLMVDPESMLQKVIVDDKLVREARRCRDMWHSLQELGGIHNSHAERLLERERQAWEAQIAAAASAAVAAPAATAAPAAAAAAAPAPAATAEPAVVEVAAPERSPDEAYIETERCSTCNECTLLNNKMFAYNENQQAYIADINAGSYAQLVEAAETCQVSVIHPGKPKNPNEPGLEDLIARAEPFL